MVTPALPPNPPPIYGVMTRISLWVKPSGAKASANRWRWVKGDCDDAHTVMRPAWSTLATAIWPSMQQWA